MTKSLITELGRCPRSFVLSLFWHGLDNESLAQKGGVLPDSGPTYQARRQQILATEHIAAAIADAGGIEQISLAQPEDESCDVEQEQLAMQEKLDATWAVLESGDPAVICDGALEGGDFVVPFSILIVRDDGLWEVYHQSTKTLDTSGGKGSEKSLNQAYIDAAPLMYVLATSYPDMVARFAVIGADKQYMTPYPDPETGEIIVDPNEAIFCVDLEYDGTRLADCLGCADPVGEIASIQSQLAQNPFWIPDAQMGSQCNANKVYECPYKMYCTKMREEQCPDHVSFFLPYHDAKKLINNGFDTMDKVLELSYIYPTMEDVPAVPWQDFDELSKYSEMDDEELAQYLYDMGCEGYDAVVYGKKVKIPYFTLSDVALRELRLYEQMLDEVEDKVSDFLS